MHIQILSSGSEGNSTLVRVGNMCVLVDAGLPRVDMETRVEAARLPIGALEHVLVTHGHLDHARSAGFVARRSRGILHCPENMMGHASAKRAKRLSSITVDREMELASALGLDRLRVLPVLLPHDCDPTVAFRLEHEGRVAVILTDMGRPCPDVARRLQGAHVLVLEFNYDPGLMAGGPYPFVLQKRITQGRGHLSNEQSTRMLELLASANLHTLVLAHLSQKTNKPEIALDAARTMLARLGMGHVRTILADQHAIGENLAV